MEHELSDMISGVPSQVAQVVKQLRVERGLSQHALAAKMQALSLSSWHQTTVAKVEASRAPRSLSMQEMVGLAAAFGVSSLDRFLSPELEAGLFAHSLDVQRSQMAALLEGFMNSDVWDQLDLTDTQRAELEGLRTSESDSPLSILDRSIDDLKRRKASVAGDARRDLREVAAEQLAEGLDT